MSDDDLASVLAWLHERLEHRFTIDAGMFLIDGAIVRGREPARIGDEDDDAYSLAVYVPVFNVRLDPDDLDVEIIDGALRLRSRWGQLGITDDGPPSAS